MCEFKQRIESVGKKTDCSGEDGDNEGAGDLFTRHLGAHSDEYPYRLRRSDFANNLECLKILDELGVGFDAELAPQVMVRIDHEIALYLAKRYTLLSSLRGTKLVGGGGRPVTRVRDTIDAALLEAAREQD